MSTDRVHREYWSHRYRGPGGRPLCHTCRVYHGRETEIPPRRRRYCGNACYDEWRRRNEPAYARERVFGRDRGVCARCGLDTEAFRKAARDWQYAWEGLRTRPPEPCDAVRAALWVHFSRQRYVRGRSWRTVFGAYGFPIDRNYIAHSAAWWEADHIVPVCEGGGECDLQGYQTLCCHCHRLATRALAARRAVAARAVRRPAVLSRIRALYQQHGLPLCGVEAPG